MRVLVVDDDPLALGVVETLLRSAGAEVRTALSGGRGLEAIFADPPDVLVVDVYMPGMDGFAFLRGVRSLPADRGGLTPAMAITAKPSFEVRRQARKAGYHDVLPKPFGREHLIRIVLALVSRPGDET